jgi:hypothetical protein
MDFDLVEQTVQHGVEWLRLAVETLGAFVIGAGIVVAVAGLARHFISEHTATFTLIRLSFARYLTLHSNCNSRPISCRRRSRPPGTASASSPPSP